MKNFSPTYRALEMYDVEKLYVEKESMDARGLTADDLVVPVEVMAAAELSRPHGRAGRYPELLRRIENMLLHTVNKSPFLHKALESCLRSAKDGSAVLLIEDGVYGALKGTEYTPVVEGAMKTKKFYALDA